MKITLFTKTGKIMNFFVLDVALMYKTLYGGVIVTDNIMKTVEMQNEKVC